MHYVHFHNDVTVTTGYIQFCDLTEMATIFPLNLKYKTRRWLPGLLPDHTVCDEQQDESSHSSHGPQDSRGTLGYPCTLMSPHPRDPDCRVHRHPKVLAEQNLLESTDPMLSFHGQLLGMPGPHDHPPTCSQMDLPVLAEPHHLTLLSHDRSVRESVTFFL